MISAIIVEDEKFVLSEIKTMVEETGFINVVNTYNNPLAALAEVDLLRPQLALIDIQMPGMDGITLAERLLEKIPSLEVVFITAHNEYAIKAFELNALDYLLKPINPRRFALLAERVASTIAERNTGPRGLLEIQFFGGLDVKINGQAVKWVRTKAEELFCFLLINHKFAVHKETILEALWSDHDPRRGLSILQTSVSKLRNIFSPLEGVVQLDYASNKYRLNISECSCDYFLVEDILNRDGARGYTQVEKAGHLIREGFLKGQGYLWAMEKEEQLRAKLSDILRSYVARYGESMDCAGAVGPLKLLLDIVPYDEEANNQLLRCYAKQNDGAGLTEHYQWLVRVLRDEYDIEPAASTRKLYSQLCKESNL